MKFCTKIGILIFTLGVVCLFSCQNEPSDIIENQEKAYSDTIAATLQWRNFTQKDFHSFTFRQIKKMVFPWHGEVICQDYLRVKLRKVITLHW